MALASLIDRVKNYITEEVDRIIKSKNGRSVFMYSGAWFIGLLGLLGLSCPSGLEDQLRSLSSSQSPQRPSKRSRSNDLPPKTTPKKHSAALTSALNELDECATVDVQTQKTPEKPQKRVSSPSDSLRTPSKRLREEVNESRSPSPPPPLPSPVRENARDCDPPNSTKKSRNLPEIAVCFSLSENSG